MTAIKLSGHEAKVKIGTDVAASEFYKARASLDVDLRGATLLWQQDGKYDLDFKHPTGSDPATWKTGAEMADYYMHWFSKCPGRCIVLANRTTLWQGTGQ